MSDLTDAQLREAADSIVEWADTMRARTGAAPDAPMAVRPPDVMTDGDVVRLALKLPSTVTVDWTGRRS